MANYLSANEWEALRKQQSNVKKTGIGDSLKNFDKARAKNDVAKQTEALESAKDNIRGAKTKTATAKRTTEANIKKAKKPKDKTKAEEELKVLKKLETYLDSMFRTVDTELRRLSGAPAQPDGVAEDDGGFDLAGLLRRAKQANAPDRSNSNYISNWDGPKFVVAMARTAGLVLSRRKVTQADKKEARSVIGKSSAKLFEGICYGEGEKLVFDMGKTKCAGGMAKAISRGIAAQAGVKRLVLVRGGGIDLDSAMDTEYDDGSGDQPQTPFEEATGIQDPRAQQQEARQQDAAPAQAAPKPIKYLKQEELNVLLQRFEQIPPERREASFDRIKGMLAQELKKAAGDQRLNDQQRNTYKQFIGVYYQRFQRLIPDERGAPPQPPQQPQQAPARSPYPTAEDWNREIEDLGNLPLDKARAKAHDIANRVNLQADRMRMDTTSDEATKEAARQATDGVAQRAFAAIQSREQTGQLEKDIAEVKLLVGRIQSTGNAAGALRGEIRSIEAAQQRNDQAWLQANVPNILAAARRGVTAENEARFQEAKLRERQDVHERVAPNMELVKNNTFVEGSAKKIAARQKELKLDKSFLPLLQAIQACEKSPSPENLRKLQETGKKILQNLQEKTPYTEATGLPDYRYDSVIEAQKNIVRQALLEADLRLLADEYEALGDPADWTPEAERKATELQLKYLFYEGAVTKGGDDPTFGARPLDADTKGINDTFWVERKEPIDRDEDASSLYIAKPSPANAPPDGQAREEGKTIKEISARAEVQREAFAKDVDDALKEATGIDAGVCPTAMVDMEGDFLLNAEGQPVDEKVHRTAVQRLANSSTPIKKLVELDDLGEKIDKKNYDDLAAYDIVTGQLDRHGGNIMVEGDIQKDENGKVTGVNGNVRMVPIDHGFSMVDAEATEKNRMRIVSDQNFLLNAEMGDKRSQLLNEETRAQIKLMRPGQLTQKLNEANARIPENERAATALTPEEIHMAERSLAFMQQACDELTVEELFYARTYYAQELAGASEADFQRVVQDCIRKAKAITDLNGFIAVRSLPGKGAMHNAVYPLLATHGGFTHGEPEELLNELIAAPDLVAKWMRICQPGENYADNLDRLRNMDEQEVKRLQREKLVAMKRDYVAKLQQRQPVLQSSFPEDFDDIMTDYRNRLRRFDSLVENGKLDAAQTIAVCDIRQLNKRAASIELLPEIERRIDMRAKQQAAQGGQATQEGQAAQGGQAAE
jgi:hypothetical protein